MPPVAMAETVVLDWLPLAFATLGAPAAMVPMPVRRPAVVPVRLGPWVGSPLPLAGTWVVLLAVLVPVPAGGVATLGLPMPLMLADRLMLLALNFSRLVRSVAESVPVVSWLVAASAVDAMTAPVSLVGPATLMSNPPLPAPAEAFSPERPPANIPLCSWTEAKSPDCLVWPNESDAPAPPKLRPLPSPAPPAVSPFEPALPKSAETARPTLVCLDLKTDVSCWLVIARLPACTSTRWPESCAPSSVSAPGVTTRAVPPALRTLSILVTSRPLLLPLPRLSEALGERPEALIVTPMSTPTDLFFEVEVSISWADVKLTLPVAESVRSRVAVTLLPMTLMVDWSPAPLAMMLTSPPAICEPTTI